MRRIRALKNIGWAVGILLCLLALAAALVFGLVSPYSGAKERHGVQLGGPRLSAEGGAKSGGAPAATEDLPGDGTLYRAQVSEDGGEAYIDSLVFLVDSSFIGLRDYGVLKDGVETTQVWASAAGNLPVDSFDTALIRYPNDGSEISPADAAMVAKPARLVLCLGNDGLGQVDSETFVAKYTALIRSIQRQSGDTTLLVCSLPSVVSGYDGSDGLSTERIAQADEDLRRVCAETGAYYTEVSRGLCDSSGRLLDQFASANGKTLNNAGLNAFLLYLRQHVV